MFRSCRLEPLEPRRLLTNNPPYALPDIYVVPPGTYLEDNVLENDRDPDQATAQTGLAVWIPSVSPPPLSVNPYVDPQFDIDPNGDFWYQVPASTGVYGFIYQNTDGNGCVNLPGEENACSDVTHVWIISTTQVDSPMEIDPEAAPRDNGNRRLEDGYGTHDLPFGCHCDCACALPSDLMPTPGLQYSQATVDPQLVATVEGTLKPTHAVPDSVSVYMWIEDKEGRQVTLTDRELQTDGMEPGDKFRIALQADPLFDLPTGHYPYHMLLLNWYGTDPAPLVVDGSLNYVSHDRYQNLPTDPYSWGSPVGATGWGVPGVWQLWETGHYDDSWHGIVLSDGQGNVYWLDQTGGAQPSLPEGLFFCEIRDRWALVDKFGTVYHFTEMAANWGLLTSIVDRNGNTTSLSYTPTFQLDTITGPFGRWWTFAYTNGLLASVTDWAQRQWSYTVDPDTRHLVSMLDPEGYQTTFSYGFDQDSRLSLVQEPGRRSVLHESYVYPDRGFVTTIRDLGATVSSWSGQAYRTIGETDPTTQVPPGSGVYQLVNPDETLAVLNDPVGNQLLFRLDRFGNLLETRDDLGRRTLWERDERGLVTTLTEPDPDGVAGPLTSSVTSFSWDDYGNLTQLLLPDGDTLSWTYDPQYSQVTSFTDAAGHTTTWLLDANGNAVQRTDPDGEETDSTYNSHGQLTSAISPDPDGAGPLGRPVLGYQYDSFGRRTRITYPDGSFEEFDFDTGDNLISHTTVLGATHAYTYDQLNRKLTAADGKSTTTYEYELADMIPYQATDGLQRETTFMYDVEGNLLSVTDALGRTTSFTYDIMDRMTQMTLPDPDGGGSQTAPVWSYVYDAAGNMIAVTDPRGYTTGMEYDLRGRMVTLLQTDPDGAGPLTSPVWSFTYDGLGNVLTETDPLGRQTTRQFDAWGRLLSQTLPDPDGAGPQTSPVWNYAYDILDNLISETDPDGWAANYTYDLIDRLIQVELPDGDGAGGSPRPEWLIAYDGNGNRVSQTDPLGAVTHWQYDALNRITTLTEPDPDGAGPQAAPVWGWVYDLVGNVTQQTTPVSSVTFTFDDLNRPVTRLEADPDGAGPAESAQWTYTYDPVGNLTSVLDPLQQYTLATYDNLDRRTTLVDPESGITSFAYDALGSLTALTDPANNTTVFDYDGLSRLVSETNELPASRYYSYDAVGNVTEVVDRNNRVRQFSYDNLDRMTQEEWLDASQQVVETFAFSYDAMGRMLSGGDSQSSYQWQYDPLSRVTEVASGPTTGHHQVTLQSEYDQAGNRLDLAASIDGTLDFENAYQFDLLGHMTSIQQTGQVGGNSVADKRVLMQYNVLGQLNRLDRFTDLAATQLVVTSHWQHDLAGRLIRLVHNRGEDPGGGDLQGGGDPGGGDPGGGVIGGTAASGGGGTSPALGVGGDLVATNSTLGGGMLWVEYQWTFDPLDRVTSFSSSSDGTVTYSYDGTSQLTGADYDYQADESFSFDGAGNRLLAGYVTGDDNQLLSDGTYNYTYDQEGNRVCRTHISSGAVTEYAWDHRNRLIQIVRKDAQQQVVQTIDYLYDVLDRRIGKTITPAVGPPVVEQFAYDGPHIVLRFVNGNLANRYLPGPVVDQILADEQLDQTTGQTQHLYWPLADNLGTIRDLVEWDPVFGEPVVVNHLTYDSFGQVTAEINAAVDHIFGFTGRETDAESELYYYRARYYDPAVGRFVSEDPLGFAAGDVNVNRYVGNSPTNATDPSGLDPPLSPGGPGFGIFLNHDDRRGRHPWLAYQRTVQENSSRHAGERTRLSGLYLALKNGVVSAGFFVEKLEYVPVPPSEGKWYQTEGAKAWRWIRREFVKLPGDFTKYTPSETSRIRKRLEEYRRLSAVCDSLSQDIAYNDGLFDAIVPFGTLAREGILDGRISADGVFSGLIDGVVVYHGFRIAIGCRAPRGIAGAVDDVAELAAQRRLIEMTGNTRNAHYLGKHSPLVSDQALLDRATRGIDPWTGAVRTNRRGQIVNLNSTRFNSYQDMLESIEKAQRAFAAQYPGGVRIPARGGTVTIDMLRDVGVGYAKNTGAFRSGLTRVRVLFDEFGQVISAYPLYR